MTKKEKCGCCHYWEAPDVPAAFNGDCCRYPQKVTKNFDDYCGEFKLRKSVEYLWEVKKDETNP